MGMSVAKSHRFSRKTVRKRPFPAEGAPKIAEVQDEARRGILLSLLAKEEEKLRIIQDREHAEAEFEINNKDQSA